MSQHRCAFHTWVRLQLGGGFPSRTDAAAGGRIHRQRAGAVVQRSGHRECTDDWGAEDTVRGHSGQSWLERGGALGVCATCVYWNLASRDSCQVVLAPDGGAVAVHLLLQHRQEPEETPEDISAVKTLHKRCKRGPQRVVSSLCLCTLLLLLVLHLLQQFKHAERTFFFFLKKQLLDIFLKNASHDTQL